MRAKVDRIRKAVAAGLSAAALAAGVGLAEGHRPWVVAGMAAAAAILTGTTTWATGNRLDVAELRRQLDQARLRELRSRR